MNLSRAAILLLTGSFVLATPSLAAITKVKEIDQSSCNFCSNGGTVTLTVPAGGVAAGNLVVVSVATNGDTMISISVSDTAGNTYTADGGSPFYSTNSKVWIRSSLLTNSLSAGNHISILLSTPTMNGLGGVATAVEFTGISASPFDKTASNTGVGPGSGGGAPVTSGLTATTSVAEELLIGAIASFSGAGLTPGSGYTALTVGSSLGPTLYPEFRVVASTGTYAATGTLADNTAVWGAVIATYKGACGTDNQPPTVTAPVNTTLTQTLCQ